MLFMQAVLAEHTELKRNTKIAELKQYDILN
jgi:hypothetical protein